MRQALELRRGHPGGEPGDFDHLWLEGYPSEDAVDDALAQCRAEGRGNPAGAGCSTAGVNQRMN